MISIPSVIFNTFSSATPIALAGVGGMFGERSGITNIGLDGTMLFAAFAAVTGCHYTGSPWIGLLCGVGMGLLISFLHAFFCITLNVNHTIVGLAVNILASSVTVYASSSIFGNKGFTTAVEKLPSLSIPGLRDLPLVGDFFGSLSIITVAAVVLTFVAHYLLYKTPFGLQTIAAGQNAHAAYVAGVNVKRTQYVAVVLGGFTCGLAGSFLSISYLNMFVRDMVSGRGFIAIAAILFGRYSPFGIFFASLFFGLADAIQIALQGTIKIPTEIVQCAPYLLTILAVTFNEIRSSRKQLAR